MIAVVFWLALSLGIFFWNYYNATYIGVRFTEEWFGFPINGGYLCALVGIYCLVRLMVRKKPQPDQD